MLDKNLKGESTVQYPKVMTKISVIVPCFNEQETIKLLLNSIYEQDFDIDDIEVIIADGYSTDSTRQRIEEFQVLHPNLAITVIDNPKRNIPAGLNRAILASSGEIIIRLDAHSVPKKDYILRCVESLTSGKGDNVGGLWLIKPSGNDWQARAIAIAASHPLGVGDARYRISSKPQYVKTVPFGSFYRDLFEKIGLYDETLLTNEDYELNARIIASGGKIWFDPEIKSIYYSRSSIKELAKQYWRYGFWKERMLIRYPETLRWRQALPPLFVISVFLLFLLGFWFSSLHLLLALELFVYFSVLFIVSLKEASKTKTSSLLFGLPLAITTMHFFWGSGFIWGLVTNFVRR